jgi:hypothetical protein
VKFNDVGPSAIRSWRNHRTRIRQSTAAMPTLRDETALVVTKNHELNGTNELWRDLAGRGGKPAMTAQAGLKIAAVLRGIRRQGTGELLQELLDAALAADALVCEPGRRSRRSANTPTDPLRAVPDSRCA